MREILINVLDEEKRVAFMEENRLDEFYIEREEGEQLIGNIYKGRVINVTKAIQAAFVDIGLEKNGFLHMSDVEPDVALAREIQEDDPGEDKPFNGGGKQPAKIEELLKEGQEVVVQVVKAPIGTKGVRLTTNVSIPGRHTVLMPGEKLCGVSRKIIDREERARLKKILSEVKLPENTGVIIRTAGVGMSFKDLRRELKHLLSVWKRVQRKMKVTKTPGNVYSELGLVLRTVRDSLTEQISKVIVDSRQEYKRTRRFISIFFPKFKTKVEFYSEPVPIFEKYGIEKELQKIFRRKVWLKKGGYIIIDPTEALVTIDVNSGKSVKAKDMEQTAFVTNLEAASEIGRQLRLRNIGGIVIIDFIDMEMSTHQKAVLKQLKEAIAKDKAKINIYPFSKLGLVELTRQRTKESIMQEVSQDCPYCEGRGKVKSIETIMVDIKRKLMEWTKTAENRAATLTVHPDVHKYLLEEDFINKWSKSFRVRINPVADKELHIEEYKVV